jgi:hypothetical protein
VEAQKRAAKDAQKKTAKAEAAEAKHADMLAKSVITIKRIERNKKKYVTAVIGLESFDLELKKVSLPSCSAGKLYTQHYHRFPRILVKSLLPAPQLRSFLVVGRKLSCRVM